METAQTTINPPFHDPFNEISSIDVSSFFHENPTLEQLEFPLNFPDPEPGHESNNLLDSEDSLSDPVIWAICNGNEYDNIGNFEAGSSTFPGESSGLDETNGNSVFGDDHIMQLSLFHVPRSLNNCSCCQKLRVITHVKGMNVKRLEIHGRLGIITHAVLEKYDYCSVVGNQDLQMFDFCRESAQNVKRFLVQYFESCKQEGYNMLQDPLSTFYEALCVGLNEDDNPENLTKLSSDNSGDFLNNQPDMSRRQESGSRNAEHVKIPLATQRARTGKLQLHDFIAYFEFPIEVAAQKLNICPTVMKKICRRNGVCRWPYRKINSIKNKISKKTAILGTCDSGENAQAMADIERHQQELADIYNAFTQ